MRTLILSIFGLAMLAAPATAQEVSVPHSLFTLPNGLRLIVHEDRSTPIVAVNVWYHVGSGHEEPGRTGFAHLFEHIMFEGSANVPEGEFDNLLEAAGAVNNGSTSVDRTNYYEILPSNALELALWLEADRMGGLLETMSQQKLDIQRDVVKNERRQSYENRPYGMFWETVSAALYPQGHPYSWSPIGSMEDLAAATLDDVESFFRRFYVPNNAVVAVAGDVRTAEVREMVERLFGWIPRGAEVVQPDLPVPAIPATRYITLEDDVTLPQVNLAWRTPPAFSPDDVPLHALASVLAEGKNSRLFRRLVYEDQIAQSVSAFTYPKRSSGDFFIRVTGREGIDLNRLEAMVLEEIAGLARTPPTAEELERVKNMLATRMVGSLETVADKADQLNHYFYYTGDPDFSTELLGRYAALTPETLQRVAREYLDNRNRIVISIVSEGSTGLAARDGGR